MKKVVTVNASPRATWNTAQMVGAAADGARDAGAQVEAFDLYKLDKFTGCISCFGCKTSKNEGRCICKDGLTPVLDAIREADGLILGSPIYLGETSAGFRALYERLVFQSLTYNLEHPSCNDKQIPALFIMTSNVYDEAYEPDGFYHHLVRQYKTTLERFVGPTEILVAGDTLQVEDYSRYNWTMFDPMAKAARHEVVFPQKLAQAREAGMRMAKE